MILRVHRIGQGSDSTLGYLTIDGVFQCWILEDEFRKEKVKGETRIPAGKYEIKFREVPSPLTSKYRQKYDFFNWHLQLQDVPNFNYVYIHIGNTDDHTDGCLLCGYIGEKLDDGNYVIGRSRDAFRHLYGKIRGALKVERVWIEIG